MLFVSVPRLELLSAVPKDVDGIELRLDLFSHIDLHAIRQVLKSSPNPVMLTVRSVEHGGRYTHEREALLSQLLELKPPFLDVEHDVSPRFLAHAFQQSDTQIVLSAHNVSDLEAVYQQMSKYPAYTYKLAVPVTSTIEALQLLLFAKTHPRTSIISMGEHGSFARVLGPVFGNKINFASISSSQAVAPGQLSAQDMLEIYRFHKLNPETAVYGLIGSPVSESVGHMYHNRCFSEQNRNAVYVKMHLLPDELPAFFPLAKILGIQGLSVTMPLKEDVVSHVQNEYPVPSVNTLYFQDGQYFGTNTDGPAAVTVLEKRGSIAEKTIVILGAGGAARAMTFALQERGAKVVVLNRTLKKARALSPYFGRLSDMPPSYHAVIQCTPHPMPIDPKHLLPKALAMDIVYSPRETEFLRAASAAGCELIYGEEFFAAQAAMQSALWKSSFVPQPLVL
jgi:3-dehydroquinate dehydratase/shikimate dehydrogenase